MKASIKRSTGTRKPSQTATERVYARYVRDLRLLLVQSAKREEKLAGMVQAVIDERFFRPVVTGNETRNQHLSSEVDSDVAVFDENEDGQLIANQARELQRLFQEQFGEQPPFERHQEELQSA